MEDRSHLASGRKINGNRLWSLPIRRDLQDGRTAQTAMCNQHFLVEPLAVARGDHLGGHPSQIAIARTVFRSEHKRHQPRPRLAKLDAKLASKAVTERK